jgi:flagellar assembly factor FliW
MNTVETIESDQPLPANDEVIHLPLGLLGFERHKEYSIVGSPEEAPFHWIRAMDDPALTFLVMPLMATVEGYRPELSDEDVSFLGLNSPSDAIIFGIVTLRANGRATVNLKGPIVLNRHTFRGKQVVLANAAEYPLRHALPTSE